MYSYLYFDHENESLINRFGTENPAENKYEIRGLKEWRELTGKLLISIRQEDRESPEHTRVQRQEIVERLVGNYFLESGSLNAFYDLIDRTSTEELILMLLRTELRNRYDMLPRNICPRLFISHRQYDTQMALKLALRTKNCGFDYWIDVEDPALKELERRKGEEKIKRIMPQLTACIIEMALINCTHVLAYLSEHSKGSLWIPYEYGRITKIPEYFGRACAFKSAGLLSSDFPDYMYLGGIANNEDEVIAWLESEKKTWDKDNTCKPDDLLLLIKKGTEDWVNKVADDFIEEWLYEFARTQTEVTAGRKIKLITP
jgi:hypothetical protein